MKARQQSKNKELIKRLVQPNRKKELLGYLKQGVNTTCALCMSNNGLTFCEDCNEVKI